MGAESGNTYNLPTHSNYWLNNLTEYLIEGKSIYCNYWCSVKKFSEDTMNSIINDDNEIIVTKDEYIRMVGKVIACGKTQFSYPPLKQLKDHITVEDIYNITIENGILKFPSMIPVPHTEIGGDINHSNYILNGLKTGDNDKRFLKEINMNLRPEHEYELFSDFSYLIFEPYMISWSKKEENDKINKVKAFNEKNIHKSKKSKYIFCTDGQGEETGCIRSKCIL